VPLVRPLAAPAAVPDDGAGASDHGSGGGGRGADDRDEDRRRSHLTIVEALDHDRN
jgi:hypothetical protein